MEPSTKRRWQSILRYTTPRRCLRTCAAFCETHFLHSMRAGQARIWTQMFLAIP